MPSKWSNVIKDDRDSHVAIEGWESLDLEEERLAKEAAEREKETPHDCSQLQQEAFDAGMEAGRQKGRKEAQEPAEIELKRALTIVTQVEQIRLDSARQAESDIVELALKIARKVIHREASLERDIIIEQVRRIIASITEKGLVRVRVHPDEVEHVASFRSSFAGSDGSPVQLSIDPDESVQPGGCIIESSQYFIDATLEKQLEAIWQEMLTPDAGIEPTPTS